ncbi:MAG: hypothetical protein WKG01_35500 [Kofleriaceae bacterium]
MDRYRLAPVREARTRDEKSRRGDLAAAVDHARATSEQVEAAARRVELARTAYDTARRARELATASATMFVLAEAHARRRRHELEAVTAEHLRAAASHAGRLEAVDSARGQLARARADREIVDRHFAAWRDTQRKLAERRED